MRKIIKDLFFGGLQPSDCKYYYNFKEDFELKQKELTETFTALQKELHKASIIARRNYENEFAYKHFKCGFKLACKIIFEGLK